MREPAFLQQRVARELGRPVGLLVFLVRSALVYEAEFTAARAALARHGC